MFPAQKYSGQNAFVQNVKQLVNLALSLSKKMVQLRTKLFNIELNMETPSIRWLEVFRWTKGILSVDICQCVTPYNVLEIEMNVSTFDLISTGG